MIDLRRWCGGLVDRARKDGAVAAEAALTHTETRTLSGRKEASRPPSTQTVATTRVFLEDGRAGTASRVIQTEADAEQVLLDAFGLAATAAADPADLPAERRDIPTMGLQIADPRATRLSDNDRRDVIAFNEDGARSAGKGAQITSLVYEEVHTRRAVLTSRGLDGLEFGTRFLVRGTARPLSAPEIEVSGTVESRRFADAASMPLGVDLARRALALATAQTFPDKVLPVVLEPRIIAPLLQRVAAAFDADRIEAGASFLPARALHEAVPIGSTRLHLVDDASLPGALETRGFDDRGVSPMPLPLIREGSSGALYRGPRAANRAGTRPTGHVGVADAVWTGNLVLRPGGRSRNMMFPDVGRYLLVDEVLSWSGLDIQTGRLSLPVRLGLGEQGHTLGGLGTAILEGSLTGLFHGIREMASDTERHGAVDGCTWVVDGLTVRR